MLRPLLAAALTTLLPLTAAAQCDAPSYMDRLSAADRAALEADAAAMPYGRGLAWEATRGDDRLAIVGTLHIADPRHDPLAEQFTAEIAEADLLMVEITAEDEDLMTRAMAERPSMLYYTDGPALPGRLEPELWDRVQDAVDERGIPAFMAAKFRPWSLMVTLSIPPCAMEAAADRDGGLDYRLRDAAAAAGVPQVSLEPYDTLVQIMDEAGEETEIALLEASLMSADIQAELFTATVDNYFAGRIAETWLLSQYVPLPEQDEAETQRLNDLMTEMLLTRRNQAWVPVIEAAARENDRIVVAAGAAHMAGEDGLLRLLEQSGWTIRPLE
ncbi:TraB/GumN family protein [Wenxinia marina]|uniref:GumN protein n=1 Tax=Wenxinia marina DSM 24838 TaxID=1123501 RepID=A0A0D0QAL6_9RHOB|nr:TraB/GumN family protein [Wenxinia marina]KIQ68018.1 hypothetical protein Wenmar_03474 [Wenxinia marina DSM 24838]GGL75352.1 TraB/GumN family protein [Wenxinia marina]